MENTEGHINGIIRIISDHAKVEKHSPDIIGIVQSFPLILGISSQFKWNQWSQILSPGIGKGHIKGHENNYKQTLREKIVKTSVHFIMFPFFCLKFVSVKYTICY